MTQNILKCLYVHSGNAGDINCCKGIVKNINSEHKILETNESLVPELKRQILKTAALYQKEKKEKKK